MTTATIAPLASSATREPTDHLRVAGICGLLAVASLLGSFLVLPADPGGATPPDIAARYGDSTGYLRAAFLETLSVGLLCLFLGGVCFSMWRRQRGALPVAAAFGGSLLVATQLVGYALVATLAHGTAGSGDLGAIMALYDLSAVCFVVANVGLAVLCATVGWSMLAAGPRAALLGWISVGTAVVATAATAAHAREGAASIHGDLGFVTLLLQMVWVAGMSVRLLRRTRGDS